MSYTTVNYNGEDLYVEIYWQPEEAPTIDYGGCNEEISVEKIFINSKDVTDNYTEEDIEEIEQLISNK